MSIRWGSQIPLLQDEGTQSLSCWDYWWLTALNLVPCLEIPCWEFPLVEEATAPLPRPASLCLLLEKSHDLLMSIEIVWHLTQIKQGWRATHIQSSPSQRLRSFCNCIVVHLLALPDSIFPLHQSFWPRISLVNLLTRDLHLKGFFKRTRLWLLVQGLVRRKQLGNRL